MCEMQQKRCFEGNIYHLIDRLEKKKAMRSVTSASSRKLVQEGEVEPKLAEEKIIIIIRAEINKI